MDEVFNSSLLISLGPSGRKALDFSEKLLDSLPKHFLDVISCCAVEQLQDIAKEIQAIVDTKLLVAKHLNKLVDLGYKVRSENISSVKLNIYLLWDVYNSEISAYEIVKTLSALNYGNIDKQQHSGVSLFILPMMEKEWILRDKSSLQEVKKVRQIIEFVSEQENLLSLDSKIYMLHCISNDGTRIPKEELEYICGIITYLNVLPSKDPPLSHFNKRLVMNEGSYKVGTIGITTLTVLKDKLLSDFSRYMSIDILNHARDFETGISYKNYSIFNLLNYEAQKSVMKKGLGIIEENDSCKLSNIDQFEIQLPKDISSYPSRFYNWEQYIEHQCLSNMKKIIDANRMTSTDKILGIIEEDLNNITLKYSLKEAVNYIDTLVEELRKQRPGSKSSINMDTSYLNRELISRVNNYPNLFWYICKCIILGCFFIYSILNLVFSRVSTNMSIFVMIVFLSVFCLLVYLEYLFAQKRFNIFIEKYKDEIFKKSGALIGLYIEKSMVEIQKSLISYLSDKRSTLIECILNCIRSSEALVPKPYNEEEKLGNLITDLLDFKDRKEFYKEKAPEALEAYRAFIGELKVYEKFRKEDMEQVLLDFSLKASQLYINLDFYEYMKFKYKDNIEEELKNWLEKGVIKSKYLLQYINNKLLEEHSIFITSPEIYKVASEIRGGKLSNFQAAVIEGSDIYTNCISLVRLCLGVEFNSITSVKMLESCVKPEALEEDMRREQDA